MKRFIGFLVLLLAAITVAAFVLPRALAQQANYDGILYASSFDQWTVPPGNNGPYAWSNPRACYVTSGGVTFPAFTVGTPVEIVDANPAKDEVVTPTKVSITGAGCSITVNPVYNHSSFVLESATGGLQEALDYAIRQNTPAVVAVTPEFSGTTSTITGASGATTVSILDARTASMCAYAWSGSAYVKGGCFGTSSSGVLSLNSLTGALSIAAGSGISVSASGSTITLSNTGITSLTTTGTNGASTLSSGVLNIPQYQGALTLTTTGTSGAATLSGDTLNVPNYATGGTPAGSTYSTQYNNSGSFGGTGPGTSGYVLTSNGNTGPPTFQASSGGGGGNPSTTTYIVSGDSIIGDDNHLVSTAIPVTAIAVSGTTYTFTATNSLTAGDWVDIHFVTGFSVTGTAKQYSYGVGVVKVLSTGLSSTQFEVTSTGTSLSACSSSCGDVYTANNYLGPTFAQEPQISGHGTVDVVDSGTAAYAVANFTALFGSYPDGTTADPVFFIYVDTGDGIVSGTSVATVESNFQQLWALAHAKNWIVIQGDNPNYGNATYTTNQLTVNGWLPTQVLNSTSTGAPSTGQYIDRLVSYASALVGSGNFSVSPLGLTYYGEEQMATGLQDAVYNQKPIQQMANPQMIWSSNDYKINLGIQNTSSAIELWSSSGVTASIFGGEVELNNQTAPSSQGCLYINASKIIENTGQPCPIAGTNFTTTQFIATGSPTVAYFSGAGTNPTTDTTNDNDESGHLFLTAGTTPAASAILAQFTLGNACPYGPSPVLTPANAPANALSGAAKPFAFADTSGVWEIDSGATALTAGTNYEWNYTAKCGGGQASLGAISRLTEVAATGLSASSITSSSQTVVSTHPYVVACQSLYTSSTPIAVTTSLASTVTALGNSNVSGITDISFALVQFTAGGSSTFTCTPSAANTQNSMVVLNANFAGFALDSGSVASSSSSTAATTIPSGSFTTANDEEIGLYCGTTSTFPSGGISSNGSIESRPANLADFDRYGGNGNYTTLYCTFQQLPYAVTGGSATMTAASAIPYNTLFAAFSY